MIKDSTLDNNSENKIRHFSIPLTKKYTAYSCIVLSPDNYSLYRKFSVLVIKVKNHQDNSDHGLCEVIRFRREVLSKDLSFHDISIVNGLLDEYTNYFNSKKFTDDEVEKSIQEVQRRIEISHEKLIEDSKREFQEIFSESYLANTPTEQILRDLQENHE